CCVYMLIRTSTYNLFPSRRSSDLTPFRQPYNLMRCIARITSSVSTTTIKEKINTQSTTTNKGEYVLDDTIAKPVMESAPWIIQFVFAQSSANVQPCCPA